MEARCDQQTNARQDEKSCTLEFVICETGIN